MNCCVTDLRNKDVICRCDGKRIGNICDVDVDTCTGKVVAIVIYGRNRCFGLLDMRRIYASVGRTSR